MPQGPSRYRETLFVEALARRAGFESLSQLLTDGRVYPPYLFLGCFFVLDFGVVNGYLALTGNPYVLLETPTVLAGPLGLVIAAGGIRHMVNSYADAINELRVHDRIDTTDLTAFERTVAPHTKLAVYAVAVVALYAHIIFNVGIENVVAVEGAAGLVNWLVVWPVAYLPFVVEFALIYFSVHVLVPRRIDRADIDLFYYDPRNMGGFAAIGQLLKRSYYLYTAGLLLYFLLTYGAVIFALGDIPKEPGVITALFFSLAWLIGVISIAYSMLTIHRIMASKKETRIRELEAEIREIIDAPYDINASEVTDQERLEDVQRRLEQVRGTRVYPATFTMWSQIAISVLLPQAMQFAAQATI